MINNKAYEDKILMKILKPLITIFVSLVFRPKVIGKENLDTDEKIILAGNHTSIFDCILLISVCKRNIHFLAKKELWNGPKKIIFSNLGLIPVDRQKKDKSSLKMAKEYLNNNKVIGIFPEGTTRKDYPDLREFKIGAVKLAKDTSTKIVPFAIYGDYKLFTKNLTIIFDKPINIEKDSLDEENTRLRNIIKNLLKKEQKNEIYKKNNVENI